MGRAPCCSKVGLHRGPWSAREDALLIKYIQANGEGNWRSLPKKAGLLRCGKSCRLRWMNYLRPDIKRGNISPEEDDLIMRLHSLLGNRWSLISGRLPGRTDNEIKNYWNTHLSKKLSVDHAHAQSVPTKRRNTTKTNKSSCINVETKFAKIYIPKPTRFTTSSSSSLSMLSSSRNRNSSFDWTTTATATATTSTGSSSCHKEGDIIHDRAAAAGLLIGDHVAWKSNDYVTDEDDIIGSFLMLDNIDDRDRDRDHEDDDDLLKGSDHLQDYCQPHHVPTTSAGNYTSSSSSSSSTDLENLYEEYLRTLLSSEDDDQLLHHHHLDSFAIHDSLLV